MTDRSLHQKNRVPVSRIEGEVGEIRAFVTAIRYMTEPSGAMDADDRAAVYVLACSIIERIETIDTAIQADTGEQPHA